MKPAEAGAATERFPRERVPAGMGLPLVGARRLAGHRQRHER